MKYSLFMVLIHYHSGYAWRLYCMYMHIVCTHQYRMAGNFRGVLIFVIFVVDVAVTKFSHPQKLMPIR